MESRYFCIDPPKTSHVEASKTFYKEVMSHDGVHRDGCAEAAKMYPEKDADKNNGTYWTLKNPSNPKKGCYYHIKDQMVTSRESCTMIETVDGKAVTIWGADLGKCNNAPLCPADPDFSIGSPYS